MSYTATFERLEKKYLLTPQQYEGLQKAMQHAMVVDKYGESTICSLYMDTDDDLLVRRSNEKPRYKEKLRLRSYGVASDHSPVYLEIKKKVSGIVYKRRIQLTAKDAMAYLMGEQPLASDEQIAHEIDYMRTRYHLKPAMLLCYDRTAYQEREPSPAALRITIDRNIRSRVSDVDLRHGDAGDALLAPDMRLMEIKTAGAYPLWLCMAMSQLHISPTSFSKYGRAYLARQGRAVPPAVPITSYHGGLIHAFGTL